MTVPLHQTARPHLATLLSAMEVDVAIFAECLVSQDWRLSFPAIEMPGIHYNLAGTGRMVVGNGPAITLTPHTLVITPPRQPIKIDATIGQGMIPATRLVEVQRQLINRSGEVQKFIAGGDEPELKTICGYFRASYGTSIQLFSTLSSPIVERFDAADQMDDRLKSMLAELAAQEIGMEAMTTTLLKQVLVMMLRRSINSTDSCLARFLILRDHQIARAFAEMVARPGDPHSVLTLAQTAGLSRSAFMARFAAAFGCSPMVALRQLRMRHAAKLLATNGLSIERVAYATGYRCRSSFFRAFQRVYGEDPSSYRALARCCVDRQPTQDGQFERNSLVLREQ